MNRLTPRKLVWQICVALLLIILNALPAASQDKRAKVRISNAGFTITALPLLAAKDWGTSQRQWLGRGVDRHEPAPRGRGPGPGRHRLCRRRLPGIGRRDTQGLQSRAIWFSSDRISYWVHSSQYKTLQDLKGKKIAISGGVGGTNHVALSIALEKLGANPKDYTMVGIPGQQLQVYYSLESGFVDAALLSPPVTFSAAKKGYYKIIDVGAMVEMPGGGLTDDQNDSARPAEVKRVIHALQVGQGRNKKSKTQDGPVRQAFKIDKEAARKPMTRSKRR